MKKILLTISAIAIGSVAFSQSKQQAQLESKPVQDPKKVPVRVVSTKKESVKKAEPAKKANTTQKQEVANPPRQEKQADKKVEKK
jgi:hypothetical protein